MTPDAASVPHRGLAGGLSLLATSMAYEFRQATAFRVGFLVRQVLRGIGKPLVMIAVYAAIFRSSGESDINGFSYVDLVHYMLMVATLEKLVFHNRALDLAQLIFEGYITKFMLRTHYVRILFRRKMRGFRRNRRRKIRRSEFPDRN